ncbi:hypothetical protein GW796_10800 [archaeon]|nr:hypothetical protein [archaeon]NCQ52350.1 hypothetical protein [archaeon]
MSSCYYGKLPFVKYLLSSHELEIHADLHYNDDSALFGAVENLQTKIIEYLISSQELEKHINLDKNINEIFDNLIKEMYIEDKNLPSGDANGISINKKIIDIIDYLIYDLSISPTEHIVQLIKENTKNNYSEPAIKRLNYNLLYNTLIENTKITTNDKKENKKIKI